MGVYDEPDIVAMTQHAIAQGYADKTQLVAGGWSQGGYLSFLSSVRNGAHGFGWRFRGVIAGAGITDWDSLVLTSDVGYMQAQTAGGSMWIWRRPT
jgi:dipeptidyl aminopeptidase/acylaminoacyl peptidase